MKKNRYMKLFGWMAAATMLLTTSCKDSLFEGSDGLSDEVTVTFNLTPEAAATVATRSDNAHVDYTHPHISDGSKADMLIYAVYDKDGKLLEDYQDKSDKIGDFEPGTGQTIKSVARTAEGGGFPYTVSLTLKRGEEYTVAFWAQSSKTKAYDTKDLKKVEVIYKAISDGVKEEGTPETLDDAEQTNRNTMTNNDEFCDAFCRSVTFKAGENGNLQQNVYLYRPLAQINVGTSGFDFETITRSKEPGDRYLYSKIRLNRVARYLDVVKDETYATTTNENDDVEWNKQTQESFAVVDFNYAPIPAYVNYLNEKTGEYNIPSDPSYTKWDWAGSNSPNNSSLKKDDYKLEEFLKVKLYDENRDVKDYTEDLYDADNLDEKDEEGKPITDGYRDYANLDGENNERRSETFKYLSMCYVLTSSTEKEKILINNVKVWLAKDENGKDSVNIVDLNHVPAQRNWRTNIVGNLFTEKQVFSVTLDRDFAGEYNGWADADGTWEYLTGPIADGVYYDAAANDGQGEIQISNANGLIWLQKMVNGDIFVRDGNGYGNNMYNTEGVQQYDNLHYNDENGISKTFKYKGYDKPDDEQLHARILAATHVEYDDENKKAPSNYDWDNKHWPEWNNFNFYGAYIRLMADIDLAGIEWIPIGWDVALHDTSIAADVDAGQDKVAKNPSINTLDAQYTQGKRRIFCGTFDGNGHTIKNLKTFRVGANVHKTSQQTLRRGPYDNPQWYPYGLFGMIVDKAKIKNVRLQNVDIKGYDACGALVGIVFSGDKVHTEMSIENCYVDGGNVTVTPMYRGDSNDLRPKGTGNNGVGTRDRTFARGVFCGGLVGDIVIAEPEGQEPEFSLTGCDVRNLTLRAYRQIGGLVGGIGNHETYVESHINNGIDGIKGYKKSDGTYDDSEWDWSKQKFKLPIEGNTVSNVLMICNQFQAFNKLLNIWEGDSIKTSSGSKQVMAGSQVWRNGFGWSATYRSLAGEIVGGIYDAYDTENLSNTYNSANTYSNVTIAEFKVDRETEQKVRTASIGSVPLHEMPMISSWFCDVVNLNANYYGQPSAYAGVNYKKDFCINSSKSNSSGFEIPFRFPNDLSPYYNTNKSNAGLFVESVILDGANGIGGRSVITPENITKKGSCVMYVTARNREQFFGRMEKKDESGLSEDAIAQPTIIRNVVLRGAPHAWSGLKIAPNKNMSAVELQNVAIYDVYRTITLTEEEDFSFGDAKVDLNVKNCNLRGYTVPGSGWQSINYSNTTFETGITTGAESNENEVKTCKVEGKTTFTNCFFKAPYIIYLDTTEDVTFTNCEATAQSTNNVTITLPSGCKKIEIKSKANGSPDVKYYDASGTEL